MNLVHGVSCTQFTSVALLGVQLAKLEGSTGGDSYNYCRQTSRLSTLNPTHLYHARESDAIPSFVCWTSIPLFYKTPSGWHPSAETCRSLIFIVNWLIVIYKEFFFVDILIVRICKVGVIQNIYQVHSSLSNKNSGQTIEGQDANAPKFLRKGPSTATQKTFAQMDARCELLR
jgi:hypothetical protein